MRLETSTLTWQNSHTGSHYGAFPVPQINKKRATISAWIMTFLMTSPSFARSSVFWTCPVIQDTRLVLPNPDSKIFQTGPLFLTSALVYTFIHMQASKGGFSARHALLLILCELPWVTHTHTCTHIPPAPCTTCMWKVGPWHEEEPS